MVSTLLLTGKELKDVYPLTDTRIMIDHAKYSIASPFHVIIWANTPKHWRQPQLGPRSMARLPDNINHTPL
jgi:hypothetical protein